MKALFDFLTLPLSLPISPVWDFVICIIIGEIAYWVAYAFAGAHGMSSNGRWALHWAMRIPLYFVLWLLTCAIIAVVSFVRANWVWVLVILGLAAAAGVAFLVIRFRMQEGKGTEESIKAAFGGCRGNSKDGTEEGTRR